MKINPDTNCLELTKEWEVLRQQKLKLGDVFTISDMFRSVNDHNNTSTQIEAFELAFIESCLQPVKFVIWTARSCWFIVNSCMTPSSWGGAGNKNQACQPLNINYRCVLQTWINAFETTVVVCMRRVSNDIIKHKFCFLETTFLQYCAARDLMELTSCELYPRCC